MDGLLKAIVNLFTCHDSIVIVLNFLILRRYLRFQSTLVPLDFKFKGRQWQLKNVTVTNL